jgi:hypothetical protein
VLACITCKQEKPLDCFANDPKRKTGKHPVCRPCDSERKRLDRIKNPHKEKNRKLVLTFGITYDEYKRLAHVQHGRCAICQIHQNELRELLCVDHNHTTGQIRGLLCHHCNRSIGLLKDSVDVLARAIKYLQPFKKEG